MFARMPTPPYPSRSGRPLVLAHRGASADAPENTLAAFREAMRQGADGVELDVMRCGSGELVVCHDAWLDRLAGEHLQVAATPLSRLRQLDLGRRFGAAFAGERMPTLGEALEALPGRALCNVELKSERTLRDGGLARKVAAELRRLDAAARIVLSSFNPLVLARCRLLAPRTPAGQLVELSQDVRLLARGACLMGAAALHVEHPLCTEANVARWHRCGLKVAAWTVDEPDDLARCCAAGVDLVITNRPGAALAELGRLGAAG